MDKKFAKYLKDELNRQDENERKGRKMTGQTIDAKGFTTRTYSDGTTEIGGGHRGWISDADL
ncbi:hypothetical protein KGD83_21775 [Nocardiopsis akebiae]|uniref:Uncharacterized protein n=1 Tax=Nocardiopsis akebiae TaxID=2831968 RepID=A0ABX8C362_9ACTN|nr:hypothetical protein [Nocardiopsis akebiae]QUX27884.1 hypothetical protein KGD83_21775 [Nocardiopsis akebiae]